MKYEILIVLIALGADIIMVDIYYGKLIKKHLTKLSKFMKGRIKHLKK